jgi:hypothetical protein
MYNSAGHNLVAVGDSALYNQDVNSSDFYSNTAVGSKALFSNTIGSSNTATGTYALYSTTAGYRNTGSGHYSLYANTTGYDNTAIGYNALAANTTGSSNIAVGSYSNVSSANLTNATVIGFNAYVDASNKVLIGNSGVTSIGGQVAWTSFSDGRYKKNIKEDVQGLAFINKLRPITYTVDINGLNAYYDKGRTGIADKTDAKEKAEIQQASDEAGKIVYNGFIAQEVEATAQKLNYNFSGVDKPKDKDGLYGLRYSDFVVPLVKAVQELSQQNDSLKRKNNELEARIERLESIVLAGQLQTSSARLEQNIPNPFNHTTTIGYSLPDKFSSAQIVVTDKTGRQLKQINIAGTGNGTITVDASTLASGAYNYSLYVDERLIATKQMVLVK